QRAALVLAVGVRRRRLRRPAAGLRSRLHVDLHAGERTVGTLDDARDLRRGAQLEVARLRLALAELHRLLLLRRIVAVGPAVLLGGDVADRARGERERVLALRVRDALGGRVHAHAAIAHRADGRALDRLAAVLRGDDARQRGDALQVHVELLDVRDLQRRDDGRVAARPPDEETRVAAFERRERVAPLVVGRRPRAERGGAHVPRRSRRTGLDLRARDRVLRR